MAVCPALVGAGSNSWQRIALSPDAGTLWVSHVGQAIQEWSYPGLTMVGTEIAGTFGMMPNFLAVDDSGDLYWSEIVTADAVTIYQHTPGGSSTGIHTTSDGGHSFGDFTVCWSPYDGNLYIVDQLANTLRKLDLGTNAMSTVYTPGASPTGSGASQTQPVPTLDGGIWFCTGTLPTVTLHRWDIPSATADTVSLAVTNVCPRPDDTVIGTDDEVTERVVTWDGTSLTVDDGTCAAVPVYSVAYTPDLSTVAFADSRSGLVATLDIWELQPVGGGWTVGRVAWGARSSGWH